MTRKKVLVQGVVVAGVCVLAGVAWFVGAQEWDRQLAARCLGVSPYSLKRGDTRTDAWTPGFTRTWRTWYVKGRPPLYEGAHASVDLTHRWIETARWSAGLWDEAAETQDIDGATARKLADRWRQTFHGQLTARDGPPRVRHEEKGLWKFQWRGPGPGKYVHVLDVWVAPLHGKPAVVYYDFAVLPPEPPPSKPIRISEAQALARVKKALANDPIIVVTSIEPRGLQTRTPFGREGEPFWVFFVHGIHRHLRAPAGEPVSVWIPYAVHATTGELRK